LGKKKKNIKKTSQHQRRNSQRENGLIVVVFDWEHTTAGLTVAKKGSSWSKGARSPEKAVVAPCVGGGIWKKWPGFPH